MADEERDIDLVDLDVVKAWLQIKSANKDDDEVLEKLITGFSRYVLATTGRDSILEADYDEVYDGNGRERMFLNNSPISEVTSITIAPAYALPQSSGLDSAGWFIEQSKKSIAIRNFGKLPVAYTGFMTYCFPRGIGNVQIVYKAGYKEIPEDLYEAIMKAIAINYRRRDWIDIASKAISTGGGGSGTTTYRNWALTPEITEVLDIYSRYARP